MKADRLITIILLLQKRKKISTWQLAAELGVSIRTIFRDLVELSANGYPIYCDHGPGGGVRIIDDFQGGVKTLTGDEIDALRLMNIPDPLSSLETGKTLQRALLKMMSSLPHRGINSPNIFIDWNWWRQSGKVPKDKLKQLYDAVCRQQTIIVEFPLWNRMKFSQEIDPYGVVAKAGEWYLVYEFAGRFRMRQIAKITLQSVTEKIFSKPNEFDLESTWKKLCVEEESGYYSFSVNVRLSPDLVSIIHESSWGVSFRMRSQDHRPDPNGWIECSLGFENLIAARTHLLGWGSAVEVLSPQTLRLSIQDFAEQIQQLYNR